MENILFPDEQVLETDSFRLEQDWEVPIPWFFILSIKRPITSLAEFTEDEAQEFISLLRKTRLGMRDVLHIDEICLYQNEATQHTFHVRIFPWHARMQPFDYKKIQSIFPIMNYAKEHMATPEIIQQVKVDVQKMRQYMAA